MKRKTPPCMPLWNRQAVSYQAAGTGFVVWIDDIALGKERIGPLAPSPP
jgi:hypothetical protein